uniref:Uncharacterized protein n=1 Tax=Romanomermis culicivorax TaxID=13658 RepID=A0A915I8K6_ROMCU
MDWVSGPGSGLADADCEKFEKDKKDISKQKQTVACMVLVGETKETRSKSPKTTQISLEESFQSPANSLEQKKIFYNLMLLVVT